MERLAPLTTLRLGGPAARVVEATTEGELAEAVRSAYEPLLVLAGGSNVVISDDGFPGTVVRVLTRGVERDGPRITVQAGEPWDELVADCVARGLQGFECLSGIPGSTGATPIQNVGAYGQEVSETVESVRVLDRASGRIEEMSAAECGFAYRTSVFKHRDRHVVLAVTFVLREDGRSGPMRYAELARRLDVPVGGTAPLDEVREAVLALRRGKGMVIDPDDPDSVSAGSFFTNPILEPDAFARLQELAVPESPARLPGARRPDQDVGRMADRALRLPARVRGGPRRDLHQAHARAGQPRRSDDGGADGAGARDRRGSPGALRRPDRARAGARRPPVVRRGARQGNRHARSVDPRRRIATRGIANNTTIGFPLVRRPASTARPHRTPRPSLTAPSVR